MGPLFSVGTTFADSLLPQRLEDLNGVHSALVADRTDIKGLSGEGLEPGFPVEDFGIGFWRWGIQEQAAKRKSLAAVRVGKKAEVADFGKALGKDVDKEPPYELVGSERHGSNAIVLFAVSPLKRDLAIVK